MDRLVTVAFSPHRVETLPFAEKLMSQHDIIILEEPPNKLFQNFLKEEISIEEYLKNTDFWFPTFIKESLKILRGLYKKGKKIFQVEPYLEKVAFIQKELENGNNIEKIINTPELKEIYQVENKAIGKLLEYYKVSLKDSFENIIEAVKTFSKADAERFRLRDYLRAQAIIKLLPEKGKVYIEAGTIHVYFKKLLHIHLGKTWRISHKYLLEKVLKSLIGKAWVFPPGELLTLRYILKRKENKEKENLLAARSLIYIKIIPKEELLPTPEEPFPHLKKELKAIQMVDKLSFQDCAKLYKELFFIKNNEESEKIVEKYLKSNIIK
ncbi:hypothetical protein [Thermodesulfobacterium hydrogeniphilum]|uniref:hypothetical protein n=1 Tax=Thermodesulfobacterium hydrogeniphilum TaxID=161156 RepID=UPI00056E7CD1|nr:hypothetical protein [Thermodesulfobacterium hydrogeniphilum]